MKFVMALLVPLLGIGMGFGFTYQEFHGIDEQFTDVNIPELTQKEEKAELPPPPDQIPADAPKIYIEGGELHDFGSMLMFGIKSHVFVVKNVGKSPLQLTKLDSTCKCTVSEVERSGIPPGESATIKMEWKAKNPTEQFRQMARFKTNDPRRKTLRLSIEGMVERSMRYYPYKLKFNGVSSSQSTTTEVRLLAINHANVEILEHTFLEKETAEFFGVRVRKMSKREVDANPGAKSGQIAYVTLKPGLPVGRIEQKLLLKTNLADSVQIEIEIKGRVVADVTFFGKRVDSARNILKMGAIVRNIGARAKMNVLVKGTPERRKKIKLKIVKVDPADILKVSLEKGVDKKKVRMHILTIDIPANSRAVNRTLGRISKPGYVVLETNDPQVPHVRLRVDFAIQ